MRPLRAAAAALLTLAFATGCASASSGHPAATATATQTAQTVSGPAACPARILALGKGEYVSPMTGEHAVIYAVTNRGQVSCTLRGYPRLVLRDGHGKVLPFHIADGGGQYVTKKKPMPMVLAPKASGYILVAKYRCDIGTVDTATAIQISLPAADNSWFTGRAVAGKGLPVTDFEYCSGGPRDPGQTVYVSPIEATRQATGPF